MNLTPQEISETIRIDEKPAPIALPQRVADARKFAHWGKLMYLLFSLLFLLLAGVTMFLWILTIPHWFPFQVIYYGIGLILSFLGAYMVHTQVIRVIDEGRFHDAKNASLIWAIIGLICGVLPGLFLFLAYMNLEEHEKPAPPPAPPPPQPSTPPPPPPQPQPSTPPPPQSGG